MRKRRLNCILWVILGLITVFGGEVCKMQHCMVKNRLTFKNLSSDLQSLIFEVAETSQKKTLQNVNKQFRLYGCMKLVEHLFFNQPHTQMKHRQLERTVPYGIFIPAQDRNIYKEISLHHAKLMMLREVS